MTKRGKKYRSARQEAGTTVDALSVGEAVGRVVKTAYAKFDESVGLDLVLGIDPTKGDQVVRGSVVLPHGTGKKTTVVAFVNEADEEAAKAAGADFAGFRDLMEKVEKGWTGFDVAVATPDVMPAMGKLAKVLGPKGLLPSKKSGTVSDNVGQVISEIKKGRVSFRNDKNRGLHAIFGKVSFGEKKLTENLEALILGIKSNKPSSSKGRFLRKAVISSTMGIGLPIKAE